MIEIRTATGEDESRVREFYYALIDAMEGAEYRPGWEKDVYPTREFLAHSCRSGELYIAGEAGAVIGCMVVNHEYNDGYNAAHWSVKVEDSELLVIHALGVHPAYSGRGIAKQLVRKAIDVARAGGIRTIRLDVLEGNTPAERAYTRMGFTYCDTLRLFYEDTGWTAFRLFEYVVK